MLSGETEASVSGWTTDTLREHLMQKLADQRDALRQQLSDQRAAVQQQFADMRVSYQQQLDDLRGSDQQHVADMREMLNERYATQTKALDAAFLAQQCVECSVLILCADLTWRPAGDLQVGDELIAFDEQGAAVKGRKQRSFRRAVVTGNALMQDTLLLVETPFGDVKCNPEHPWLVKTKHENKWEWRRTADIRRGNQVMHIMDVWPEDRTWEGGWLSGMFDGEGWLTYGGVDDVSVRLGIAQADGPTADDLLIAIKERLGRDPVTSYVTPGRYHNQKGVNRYQVSKRADVLKFLGSVRPRRLLADADRAWEDRGISGDARATTVTSVTPAGTGMIASLSTSTGTYIGAGFAMHNTAMRTALEAAEKAVATALTSAEKAVAKAEVAADKRFESVNEFRQQLSDQTATFLPRIEYGTAHQSLIERISGLTDRLAAIELRLTSRLDLNQGSHSGASETRSDQRVTFSQVVAVAAVLATVATIIVLVLKK